MLERFKFLHGKLAEAEAKASGDYVNFFRDRRRAVGNWIADLEAGRTIDTEYACNCASDFERALGL